MKYFVKLVDIIAASAAITAKNSPVPIQREEGSNVRRSAFERIINKSITTQTTRQIRRRAMAFKNSPCTSSMWAISRSLKNSRVSPPIWVVT